MARSVRWSHPSRRDFIFGTVLALGAGIAASIPEAVAQSQSLGEERLALDVSINGATANLIGNFVRSSDGRFWAAPDELREMGLDPARLLTASNGLVLINALPGADINYDVARQLINITVSPVLLRTTHLGVQEEDAVTTTHVSGGAVVNYSVFASADAPFQHGQLRPALAGEIDARVFGRFGVVASSAIVSNATGSLSSTRLDTSWVVSDPARLTSYRVGDMITRGLSWTRPIRMGGIQISRSFELRPDLITQPLSSIRGTAEVPSTLSVLVNNSGTYTSKIPQGPFDVEIPATAGGGLASVHIQDALGRNSVIEAPFYGSDRLLSPRYTDYALEIGFARRNFGSKSADYDSRLAATGTVRTGLSSWATVEGHAEGTSHFANIGGGLITAFPPVAMVAVAGAVSTGEGGRGAMADVSFESKQSRFFALVRAMRTFGNYSDLASQSADRYRLGPGTGIPRSIDQVQVGGAVGPHATLSLTYSRVAYNESRAQLGVASFSQSIGAMNLYLRASQDFERGGKRSISLGISVPLGQSFASSEASVSAGRVSGIAEVQSRAPQQTGEYGWRARMSAGESSEAFGAASVLTSVGLVEGGVRTGQGTSSGFARIDGALAFLDGRAFASKHIDGAFALVDVGQAGVPVTHEHRTVGVTSKRGTLLLADLLPYQVNRVGIDARYLDQDRDVSTESVKVVPRASSGVVVHMSSPRRSALVPLVDADGQPLPVGSKVVISSGASYVVGYGGLVFLPDATGNIDLRVEIAGGRQCRASIDRSKMQRGQTELQPVACRQTTIALN